MESKVLARGAEAVIIKDKIARVIKKRIPKSYRHPLLDEKLRKQRTRREAKLINKANSLIPSAKLIKSDEKSKEIEMELISGKKLSESLDKLKDYNGVCEQIGINIAKLHDSGIIHGDLTTSNMILKDKKVYFIDFGLGFHSERIEDKAVDLHLIKQALEAKHPKIFVEAFKSVLKGYKKSKSYEQALQRLERVEKRGRYKEQY